jgi:hypothetical protein
LHKNKNFQVQKFSKTSDGKKGGLFVGKKHSEGGIPAIVVDTGQPIEVEGGEAIINAEATALHWEELSKINQSTGGVPIPKPTQAEKLFEKFENGGKLTVNDKKTIYQKWKSLVNMSYSELLKYYNSKEGKESGLTKSEADSQGISSGRESARWIMKMKKTNYKNWTDTMWRWANKQISFISRMRGNQGELYDDKGRKTRKLMSLLIWGHNPNKYKPGGTIAQTPAPKKERISGSSVNKPGSSANISSAKSIQFSEDLIETLKNKVKDHNETHPDKKINLSVAKAVVRRGMGAYSSSHRPTISGGKPNSRTAWGLARLNAFLYKIINGESKSGKYSEDNDLIETLGYRYKKYNDGGPVSDDKYIDIGIDRLLHEFRNEQEIFDGEIVKRGSNDFKIENGIFYIKRPNENWEVFRKIKYADGGILNNSSFKKWFGNSKVLDKKGNPLIVYHGSPDLRGLKENYIFQPRFLDDYAFFFTDNYSMAKSYADPKRAFDYQNAEEGVIGLYLSLQNPLIVNAYNQIWRKFETTIDENKIIGTRNLIKYAQEKGYDGVIVNNVRDFYNENERRASGGNLYVAFKPEQIKIADGSNNTFDSNNPDIRFDVGGPVKKIEGKNMKTIYTKRDIYNFVLKNSYLQFDGDKEDLKNDSKEITFSTRENGDVGNEIPGRKDINEAFSIKRQLENEFNGIETEIHHVDEWVMLNIFLPEIENRLNIPEQTETDEQNLKIRDWYIENYPTDDLAEEMNDETTFENLWDAINTQANVYDIIGVDDSVVRERLFEKLSDIYEVDYFSIYNSWLGQEDLEEKKPSKEEVNKLSSINKKQLLFSKQAKKIVPKHQLKVLESINYSEQEDAIENINNAVFSVPKLYGQDGVTDKTIYIHYFYGNQDWYITEYDRNSGEFFGYVNLGYGAEMGYLSVDEIVNNGKIELDFYFQPTLWSNIDNDKESSFDKQNKSQIVKEEVIDFYFFDRHLPKNWIAEQALINGENLLEELENYSYEIDNDPDRLSSNEIEVKTDNFTIYLFDNTTEFKFGVRYNEKLKNVVDDVATILTNLDPIPTTNYNEKTNKHTLRPIHDIAKDIIDLVSDVNRAVETKLKSSKNEFSFDLSTYKNPYELNKAIERYLDENVKTFENAKDVVLSPEAKAFIKNYSGYGGLNKFGEISVGSMFEFFTPKKVIEKMWALAYKYGYSADGSILETSVGTGEFLQYANPLSRVVAYEINKYSAMITQILYPFCSVNLEPFEKVFIKNNNTIGNKIESLEKFDLVIGNCPYGDFSILDAKATRYLLGFGEQKFTKSQNYIEYFLRRSIDMLNTNGLLIMIVGAEVRNGAKLFLDSPVSPVKEYLAEHSILLDAYRLPDKTFERTGVTSDIIVLRKK